MKQQVEALIKLLALEPIEKTIFRGQSQDLGWGRVYGGQVMGQALSAARQTVDPERHVHSFHGYFLREGDTSKPIVYTVDCIRDGKSFTTRRVVALQDGQAIFNMSASFQKSESGFDHQDVMPNVPSPEESMSERELMEMYRRFLPPALVEARLNNSPIEMRFAQPLDPMAQESLPPQQYLWMRTNDTLPDTSGIHKYFLAYASDFQFLPTALYPHGAAGFRKPVQIASLDHAMWFHRPFRSDEWLLHCIESPSASASRALVRGRIFNQAGELVASTIQEGLIRSLQK